MNTDNTKDTLILIKSVEKGFPVLGTDVSTIPPMGTMNKDGEPTYEQGDANGVVIACESDPTFVKSKPWRPMFEILFGHTALGFKQEPDKIDSQDTSRPKDYIRGHDVYNGNMSFDKPTGENRLEGATDGSWDPVKLCLEPYKHFRWFEIWVLRNPRDASGNILMNVNAVKCDMLTKHYYCLFDSLEESDDSAIRLSVPITRRYYQRFKNFKFPTSQMTIHTEVLHDAGSIVPLAQPREHTRLNLKITAKTGTGSITVKGLNVCKQPIQQVFTASVASLLGDEYFYSISEIIISPGLSDVSFTLYDYDYTIQMPALA